MKEGSKIRAVLLDRDGVVNQEGGHVLGVDSFKVLPGVARAVALLNGRGVKVALVTNQSGVARGLLSFAELEVIHEKMRAVLAEEGGHLDALYVSPWHPDVNLEGGVPEWLGEHEDRKPGVGMLRKALAEFQIDAHEALMIGDSGKDYVAATRMGVAFRGVKSAKAEELEQAGVGAEAVYESLWELVSALDAEGLV